MSARSNPIPPISRSHDPDGNLHKSNHDLCCHIRKTIPLEKALQGFDVVISGRKRYHGGERRNLTPISVEGAPLSRRNRSLASARSTSSSICRLTICLRIR